MDVSSQLEKFRINESIVTEEIVSYFLDTYGVDLLVCTVSDIKLLVDFMNHGASQAIMNKILEIRESQNES